MRKHSARKFYGIRRSGKIEFVRVEVILRGNQSADKTIDRLRGAGITVTDSAVDIIRSMRKSHRRRKLALTRVSGKDLGFSHRASAKEIYDRAAFCGLALVAPEAGPELCLRYFQHDGDHVLLAMDPVSCDGYPHVFALTSDAGIKQLDGEYGSLGHSWMPSQTWLFSVPDPR